MKLRLVTASRIYTLFGAAAGALLFLAACTSSHRIKVDALSRPDAEKSISYRIRSGNPGIDEDTLRYKEAANYIKTALSGRGMYEAPSEETADIIIDLDYGVGPPRIVQEVVKTPRYRTVPGRVYSEVVVVGVNPKTGQPITAVQTYQEPDRQQFIGYDEFVMHRVLYEKYVRMAARENEPSVEGRPPPEVWQVDVSTEGESDDMRKSLPVLAAATIDYIGRETTGKVSVRLKADSPDIDFVKQGM